MSERVTASEPATVILLVDDDADCRQLVSDAIRRQFPNVEIYEVDSGEEAMRFLCQKGLYAGAPLPALIYMDLEMPGLNGIETVRLIRSQARLGEIAIVMMTGVTDDRQKSLAMRSGVNSYTNKPVSAERFFETVRTSADYWLRIHQYPHGAAGSCAA